MCLLAKKTREPPEATILSWMSWRNWPTSQAILCATITVRVNHTVSTTAAASNKQGDVELVNFGLDGSNNLVIDISISCDHIVNSTVNNRHLNGKMHSNDYLQARAGAAAKNRKYEEDYAAVSTAFAPAIV